ncbi:chromosomal replication initiator protein DnaA [Alicyclobacillus cycloheptanicus]|uniref:Chromosomal replication initiator protein DnaA n=1 Tax=Alicyclobacillus cycloheptanicus TaxID=1457 RepID=A0ABT9XL58_9BACL|nr:chromosomal replication initiator protein DnaA [Alicyclobacillus cycloheptanicus]MDQ0190952.1 chromosomal replication initiator protein [Alicyclobacillus cycloheptanicus]WDM02401.1 chromosomal replication initiator protein DnaA [Alicyclobacillus cycloheptanicus]
MSTALDTAFFETLWENMIETIRERMNEKTFDTWFNGTKIIEMNEQTRTVTVFVPTTFTKNWIVSNYRDVITDQCKNITGQPYRVQFVTPTEQTSAPEHTPQNPRDAAADNEPELPSSPLNPRYTFSTFVIGTSNRFAHAACLAVAEAPANSYNPLFIYGGVGLGKTHLMHAICHSIMETRPDLRVMYLSCEQFINDFITSLRNNTSSEFRKRYRSIDVLLVDDIQFLAKKESTQEEFFHTFNALHGEGKQIVLSSDRPPREIPTLEDRLRSRFEWGLITDIQPPELETRVAILQRKAKADGFQIPEDVAFYIANQIDSNIRELEGALIRVVAYSSLVNQDIDIELAQQALKEIIGPDRRKGVTVQQIQKVIGDHYGLKIEDLKAKNRSKTVAFPRQIAMYLVRELTDLSLPRIGAEFGGRDHTTVMHACEKVSTEIERDPQLRMTIERLSEAIRTLC